MSKLIVTIDTEHFTQAPGPLVKYPNGAWCTCEGVHCGFPLVMEICERYGIRATFFVNVFEYKVIGEKLMAAMCDEMLARGHDVQLHTHPSFVTGKPFLCDSPLQEQTELIGHGKEKLEAWTGRRVVAHRAGYYAANEESIVALRENGIHLDSSSLYGHRYCHVDWTKFELAERDGSWELPISWFNVADANGAPRRMKFDIDKGPAELLAAFADEALSIGYGYLTFAAHSFSFLRVGKDGPSSAKDGGKVEGFDRLLRHLTLSRGIESQTLGQLWHDIERKAARSRQDGREVCLP